jgi:hypothetical protein
MTLGIHLFGLLKISQAHLELMASGGVSGMEEAACLFS